MFTIIFALITIFGSARDLNEKGNKFYKRGKYDEAIKYYGRAQVKKPEVSEFDYNLGCAFYKKGNFAQAEKLFKRFVLRAKDKKNRVRGFYNLGNTYLMQGNLQEAIKAYKEALRINPADKDAKINLELALRMLKKGKGKPKPQPQPKKENEQKKKQRKEELKRFLRSLTEEEKQAKKKSAQRSQRKVLRDW